MNTSESRDDVTGASVLADTEDANPNPPYYTNGGTALLKGERIVFAEHILNASAQNCLTVGLEFLESHTYPVSTHNSKTWRRSKPKRCIKSYDRY